ncbi:hypothetical protein AgCh_005482 [Apium graveolens]
MFLDVEDIEARKCLSIKALLVSSERNYVINNRGDKVNVCDLEDKVVALYLYEDGCTDNDLTPFLEKTYRKCTYEKIGFEVVLVYIHDSPNTFERTSINSFAQKFNIMQWLALPFKDINGYYLHFGGVIIKNKPWHVFTIARGRKWADYSEKTEQTQDFSSRVLSARSAILSGGAES